MERKRTLMMAMARTRRAWNNHVKEVAHSIGIPDSYRMIISFLHRNPGANQRNIAEFADVTTSAVNQTVKSMQEEGYLKKETDEAKKEELKQKMTQEYSDKFASPYQAASNGSIDEIIEPAEARSKIINALRILKNKRDPKKHTNTGNIPL